MPYLSLKTSAPLDEKQTADLLPKLSKALCEATGKPESYCMVAVDKAALWLGGTVITGAFVDIRGIGGFNETVNKKVSAAVCALLHAELGLSPRDVYINFTDVAAHNWGHDATTFA